MEIKEIKNLWDQADEYEGLANDLRWQVAEAISVKLLEPGVSQRGLSKELGPKRSQALISYYNRVWVEREVITQVITDSESFQEAYRWVQDNPKKPRPPKPQETESDANAKAAMQAELDKQKAEADAEKKRNAEAAKELIEEVRAANAAKAKAAAEARAKAAKSSPSEAEKKAKEAEKAAFVDGLTKPINDVLAAITFTSAVGTMGEMVDTSGGLIETLQEVVDKGYPVASEDLKDAYDRTAELGENMAKIGQLLMTMELLIVK